MAYFAGTKFKVTLEARPPIYDGAPPTPERVFIVRALDRDEAFKMALMIENVYERPAHRREREMVDTIIEALTGMEDE